MNRGMGSVGLVDVTEWGQLDGSCELGNERGMGRVDWVDVTVSGDSWMGLVN